MHEVKGIRGMNLPLIANLLFVFMLTFWSVAPPCAHAIEVQTKFENPEVIRAKLKVTCNIGSLIDIDIKDKKKPGFYKVTIPFSECKVTFQAQCRDVDVAIVADNGNLIDQDGNEFEEFCGTCTWKGNGYYKNVVIEGSNNSNISCKAYSHWLP